MRRVLATNPRSGTHYLKMLISAALDSDPVEKTYAKARDLDAMLSAAPANRLVYGHFQFREFSPILDTRRFSDLRLIVLTRHPFDRMISQCALDKARGGHIPSTASTAQQLAREMLLGHWDNRPWESGYKVADYAAVHNYYLGELVSNWVEFRRCLMVRFEHLVARPIEVLAECLDHLEIRTSIHDCRRAVSAINFESLSSGRRPGEVDVSSHYRCGIPGEWRGVFSPEDIESVRPKYVAAFARAGYLL